MTALAHRPPVTARLRGWAWRLVSCLCPERLLAAIVRRKLRAFETGVGGLLTDKLLELMLFGMELAFFFWKTYRDNLQGFRAQYVLRTADGRVEAAALFDGGRMWVKTHAVPSPTVTVTFKTPAAFRRFLSSKDQDILQSLMADEVMVDGNLNYVYKMAYMARVLLLRLGIS